MKTNPNSVPLTEGEKQTLPLPGEVSPQDLLHKALTYAAIERLRVKPGSAAAARGGSVRPGKAK
jgi:hypothetical protein